MPKILVFFTGFCTFLLMFPFQALAHVKWFVPAEEIIKNEELTFSVYDPIVLGWIGVILALLLIGIFLERFLRPPKSFTLWVSRHKNLIPRIFQFLLGLFFLISAYEKQIVAPIFLVDDGFSEIMKWMQFVLAMLLIFDIYLWFASFLLMLLGLFASFKWGFIELFDHLHLLGAAMFLFIMHHPKKNFVKEFRAWALPGLRVLTGVSLVVLAFSEKLLHPELGLEFLKNHQWNFVTDLGMDWFSDYFFVISAGATEFILGLFLVLGLLTRITTIVLALFMLLTAAVLGPQEVWGHLSIFALAILFLAYGSGDKLRVFPKK